MTDAAELIAALTRLAGIGQDMIWTAAVVFLRVGAAMALLPALGEQMVPVRVRLALALCFTAIVGPAVASTLPAQGIGLGQVLLTETVIGLALGFVLRLFVQALQTAGMMIAQATSLSQLFAGAQVDPQPAIGHLLTMAGLALAVSSGLAVRATEYLILSYQVLPAGRLPTPADMGGWGLAWIGHGFALAFSLAAPFIIASFVYNLALGVINRAMPQLMVSFIGAPALALGSLALLFLSAPLLLMVWKEALDAFLAQPFRLP